MTTFKDYLFYYLIICLIFLIHNFAELYQNEGESIIFKLFWIFCGIAIFNIWHYNTTNKLLIPSLIIQFLIYGIIAPWAFLFKYRLFK